MHARTHVRDTSRGGEGRGGGGYVQHCTCYSYRGFSLCGFYPIRAALRAASRSFSLRMGVTVTRDGGVEGEGGREKARSEGELCYSFLLFDIVAEEILSATFLRAT